MDEKEYKKAVKLVESDLRDYPYFLISLEASGLGQATNWNKIKVKPLFNGSSIVENQYFYEEEKERIVEIITTVLSKLDPKSKEIIEKCYFTDIYNNNRKGLLNELNINKNEFYKLKKQAIRKFVIALYT
ncbi:hypothetical protein [Clostridium ihumii]|uniref:hypothetical protein n=1 Tax=Clostridium ihumii TaxID=1470356 RepID=UPI00054FED68|nr:hypothetical protein [Clostridium ihumii]